MAQRTVSSATTLSTRGTGSTRNPTHRSLFASISSEERSAAPSNTIKYSFSSAYEGVRGFISNASTSSAPADAGLPTPVDPTSRSPTPNCTFIPQGDCASSLTDALADLKATGITVNPLSLNLIGMGTFAGNGPFPGLFPANNGTNPAGNHVRQHKFPQPESLRHRRRQGGSSS